MHILLLKFISLAWIILLCRFPQKQVENENNLILPFNFCGSLKDQIMLYGLFRAVVIIICGTALRSEKYFESVSIIYDVPYYSQVISYVYFSPPKKTQALL